MDNSKPERKPPVKGSWEDLLLQAEQHSANFNDAAIPLYRRVVDGLAKLSPAARNAGNQRLFKLFMRAALDLQGFYNIRGRYDDALAVFDLIRTVATDEEDLRMSDVMTAQINLMAGEFDKAIAFYRGRAEADDAEFMDWQSVLWAYVNEGRAAEALELLPLVEQSAQTAAAKHTESGDAAQNADETGNPLAFNLAMSALVKLEAGLTDDALADYDTLIDMGAQYAGNAYTAYTRLAQQGHYEDALRFVDRDRGRPVRAAFWRGLILRRMGEPTRAREAFTAAANREALKQDQRSIVEQLLAQFFLGDPEAEALETILGVLREQKSVDWLTLLLAALGWTVRGDFNAAQSNLRIAATHIQWHADGRALPRFYWFIAQELVPAEHHELLRPYFVTDDTDRTPAPTAVVEDAPAAASDQA